MGKKGNSESQVVEAREKRKESFRFSVWYEKNGEARNAKRREEYANNPEVRERIKARNAEARARNRKAVLEERRQQHLFKVTPTAGWKEEELPGVGKVYSIGALSALTGRSVKTLRLWESRGEIPDPVHRDRTKNRLYTREQLNEIIDALTKAGKISEDTIVQRQGALKDYVLVEWGDGSRTREMAYSISQVAEVMERSVSTLGRLERKGLFPATPLFVAREDKAKGKAQRHRRFLYPQILVVADTWAEMGFSCRGEQWEVFKTTVEKGWAALGLDGARIIDE